MKKGAVKWGKVADPAPRIIRLLRTIKAGAIPQSAKDEAHRCLDEIIAQWDETESLAQLREALGVNGARGGRRTQRAVSREFDLVLAVINAALAGKDVSNYRKAADELQSDEKVIERAWRQWSSVCCTMIEASENSHGQVRDALSRVPPVAS